MRIAAAFVSNPDQQGLTAAFAGLLLPQIFFYALTGMFIAVLNVRHVFAPGAWAPVVNNVVVIGTIAIFFTLPDNILHALARRLAPASATKGSGIVHQGDPGDTMFVVESGRCEVFVEESPGHTITIALMGPDDFFGEMALISEETRTASVRIPRKSSHAACGSMLQPKVVRVE